MATTRPFALNTGSTITGTLKVVNVSIGVNGTLDFLTRPGNVDWWMGPDEDLGYVIAAPDLNVSISTPIGINAGVGFWRTSEFTDVSFLNLANMIASARDVLPFTGVTDAASWLTLSGYPHSYSTYLGSEKIVNGDGTSTDWIDSNSDGIADNWTRTYSTGLATIITGSGFTGNAQRLEVQAGNVGSYCGLLSTVASFQSRRNYRIEFDVMSNRGIGLYAGGGQTFAWVSSTNDQIVHHSIDVIANYGVSQYLQFYYGLMGAADVGTYAIFDNVSVKEIFWKEYNLVTSWSHVSFPYNVFSSLYSVIIYAFKTTTEWDGCVSNNIGPVVSGQTYSVTFNDFHYYTGDTNTVDFFIGSGAVGTAYSNIVKPGEGTNTYTFTINTTSATAYLSNQAYNPVMFGTSIIMLKRIT